MEENNNVVPNTTIEKEGSKFGWGVLGFLLPLVGLILFLVWMKDKKKSSKAAGIGALVGFLLQIVGIILFFVLGLGTLIGIGTAIESYGDNSPKPTENNTVENSEEEEEETVDPSDLCTVTITKGDKNYLYNYSYNISCENVTVIDDNNKVLFKISDEKIVLKNGEKLDNYLSKYDDSGNKLEELTGYFYKVDNSLVLGNSWCSPGFCYIYVYNTADKTGFKVKTLDDDELLVPSARTVEIDSNKNLVVFIRTNTSAGFEGMRDDPRVVLLGKIANCEINDIDSALSESSLDDFAISETYTYKYSNKQITNEPTVKVSETIKDYYHGYDNICNRQ